MPKIHKGHVVAFFAFDIGFEILLDRLNTLPASTTAPPLSKKKQTPAYLQYTIPPRIIGLGETAPLADCVGVGQVQATLFDFGAASVAFQWPFSAKQPLDLETLPQLSNALQTRNLELEATQRVEELARQINSARSIPR
jgi:hypothetical protein